MGKEQKQWRRLITEEYKKKYYPDGYFGYLKAENSSMAVYIVGFVLVGILFNLGFWVLPFTLIGYDFKLSPAFFVSLAVGILWFLLASLLLRIGRKRKNRTKEDWIAETAQTSGLTESEVREFDRQVVEGESYFLTLKGKLDSVQEAILTEDYYSFGTKAMNRLLPYRDILGGCFTFEVQGRVKVLSVAILTADNYFCIEAGRELGTEFLTMLRGKNPRMEVRLEGTMRPGEVEKWSKQLKGRQAGGSL